MATKRMANQENEETFFRNTLVSVLTKRNKIKLLVAERKEEAYKRYYRERPAIGGQVIEGRNGEIERAKNNFTKK